MNFELKHQSHFAKLIIDVLDPILKPLRVKVSHFANQQFAHEIADDFPLTFGKGMHRAHARIFNRIDAPLRSRLF
jgi:hypothetical protein